MEYIIIGLLALVVILIIILLFKKQNNNVSLDQDKIQYELKLYLKEEYGSLKLDLAKLVNESDDKVKNNLKDFREEYNTLKLDLIKIVNESDIKTTKNLNEFKTDIIKKVDDQLNNINKKVEERLEGGFKQSQATFVNVVERLTKIDEAQKNIEKLSGEVFSLNNILTDKKTRGTFGEIQLHHLIYAVFGNNDALYEEQKKLSNGTIADLIVYAPKPLGSIVIDSKFPLNSYQNMYDGTLSDFERQRALVQFKADIKKHIDDISSKYIISNETANQAIMFIPAEAIFSEIVSNHNDLVEYSNKKLVWFASPTTLLSTLTIIQTIVKNMERDAQAQLIVDELKILAVEFSRYATRWDKLERTATTLTKDIREVNITSTKISDKFKNINEGKLDYIKEDKEEIEL